MKFRKDAGTSKIPSTPSESPVQDFITEVVDIHRVAFSEARRFFDAQFADIHDLESLQSRVTDVISQFVPEIEQKIESLRQEWSEAKDKIQDLIETTYEEKKIFLQSAQEKAEKFVDSGRDTLQSWITQARSTLDEAYNSIKKNHSNTL